MANPHLKLEGKLWSEDITYVAGIDEVGRGPWAGPLMAGAVCYKKGFKPNFEVKDSKKLSEGQREELCKLIKQNCLSYGVGIVEPNELDELGLTKSVNIAMIKALRQLEKRVKIDVDYLLIDGASVKEIPHYEQRRRDKADGIHFSVASASIIAKVTRDRLMVKLSKVYPEYGFEKHKGYGTKLHKEALEKYGPCPIHRFSFKPVREQMEKFES